MTVPTRLTPADLAALPLPPGRLSKQAFDTGEIELRYYAPVEADRQVPHDRDELYFIASGAGTFVRERERVPFRAGDVLFAAAGETHRFEDFSADFATWVLFYGPARTPG
jgi:mannose-6-phosphate isomerase-like protein (cupin superfamily)